MAQVFALPAVGDTMLEGEIVEWFVAVGDVIDLDQVICAVETDKSVVEMSTPYRGTVLRLGGEVGEMIAVGDPLIVVGEAGETPEAASTPAGPVDATTAGATPAGSAPPLSPLVRRLAADNGVDTAAVEGTGAAGRITRDDVDAVIADRQAPTGDSPGPVRAMPKVRKMARELSIDLATVTGSGPDGSILESDLTSAARPAGDRRERLSATRRAIARHLAESARTIPQFTSMVDVDATALLAARSAIAERTGESIPLDALFTALLVQVLEDHPLMNAMLDGDEIVYRDRRDIGIAVDTADGLMVPVVRNADQRSIRNLAGEIVRLAEAARSRTIAPDDLSGATCTVNNVGSLGVFAGTPILPLQTSVIVAFGVAHPVVRLRGGSPVEVPTITISATFDHRLVDGGDSGRFLGQLKRHMETPLVGTPEPH
jgi:pyruvate dehydrogenase E2 component (dihydrolipoamide acetyltransferase)